MVNFFKTSLKLHLQECENEDEFLGEYLELKNNADVFRFKKLASKLDFDDTQKFLFDLLLDIKNDIFKLKNQLKSEQRLIKLSQIGYICGVNFDFLEFKEPVLSKDKLYYARLELNDQIIAFFMRAGDERVAEFVKIKNDDKLVFDHFVMQTQRELINDLKGKKDE